MSRVVVLTGTMPDIIKQSPLVWEGDKRNHDVCIIHSGQHKADNLVSDQYNSIGLRSPDVSLDTIDDLHIHLRDDDIVLVHGDTNTAREGALIAHFINVRVGHIESGLRTLSREPWPEQTNTRIADACSNIFFPATETNFDNLLLEGFPSKDIYCVGNTVVDMVLKFEHDVPVTDKIWFCVHRHENMRDPIRMEGITKFLYWLSETREVHFIDRQRTSWIDVPNNVERHQPIPYVDSLNFMKSCGLVITDSGSIQEETCTLGIPTITVRQDTDRPESIGYTNQIGGTEFESLKKAYLDVKPVQRHNIYGNGNSAELVWNALEKYL